MLGQGGSDLLLEEFYGWAARKSGNKVYPNFSVLLSDGSYHAHIYHGDMGYFGVGHGS
jgi:hypothetical protein